jgi:putative phosphoribosyl transferase
MVMINDDILKDRKQAAQFLGEKLTEYKNQNAIVVSVSRKSAATAYHLAEYLQLPFEIFPCKEIKHPGISSKTIGSVSADEVLLHDDINDIPKDFIYRQIQMIQHSIKAENKQHQNIKHWIDLKYKSVIVVTDILQNTDMVQACLRSIKKQNPLKVIVAAIAVAPEPARIVASEVDQITFLKMETHSKNILKYENSSTPPEEELKLLLAHTL